MSDLPSIAGSQRTRARRWDVLILGSGIRALVAAARLGAAGQRVLVVEEDATRVRHPALREPFFLAGRRNQGVLDACLRQLHIPLIDQRRIAAEWLAFQLVSDAWRLDIGGKDATADELAGWGLCGRREAIGLLRALGEAGEVERRVLLSTPLVHIGRRFARPRGRATPGPHLRGLPAEATNAAPGVAALLAAQVSVLSNLGQRTPSPEGQARLLGDALSGGAGFGDGPPWLHALLRRRVEAVCGEFRTLPAPPRRRGDAGGPLLELVSVDGQPAVCSRDRKEIWAARTLVLAAPMRPLCEALGPGAPGFLDASRSGCRRLTLHLRIEQDALPRGIGQRLILLAAGATESGTAADSADLAAATATETTAAAVKPIALTAFANPDDPKTLDLVARMRVGTSTEIAGARDEMEARVRAIMPFSDGRIQRLAQSQPLWDDDDGWLEDPPPGGGWPGELDLRSCTNPPVYILDRSCVAGLGLEGDLLLGWRAGDAIAEALS